MKKIYHRELGEKDQVEYITDVEGNWDYFSKLVANSKILKLDDKLHLDSQGILVFGGDVVDKGSGDIRITKLLTQLKRDNPERVFFILGNRDVNKLRFISELDESINGTEVDVYWDNKHKPYDTYLKEKELTDSKLSQLKWMLECTMGCQTTFEKRREELCILNKKRVEEVTDEEVYSSFRDSVDAEHSDHWMLEFIELGQLSVRLGPFLFVHGGLTAKNVGMLPQLRDNSTYSHPYPQEAIISLDDWVEKLGTFFETELQNFRKTPLYSKGHRGGENIMDYGVPGGGGGRTVIYEDFLENGNAVPVQAAVESYAENNGISAIITGHKPHGDCPCVISSPTLTVLSCDTSYSDTQAPDMRGQAYSTVSISKDNITVGGVLADGTKHGYSIPVPGSQDQTVFQPIGTQLGDKSWVKTRLHKADNEDSPSYLAVRGEGFKLHTQRISEQAIRQQQTTTASG